MATARFPLLGALLLGSVIAGARAQEPAEDAGAGAGAAAVADERTESRLKRAVSVVPDLHGMEVAVKDGVVTLSGTVASKAARDDLIAAAREHPGVFFVHDATTLAVIPGDGWARTRDWMRQAAKRTPTVALALAILAGAVLLARMARRWDMPRRLARRSLLMQAMIGQALALLIVAIGVLLALDLLGATALLGAVVGTAGILGIALSLAFRDVGSNFLASLSFAMRKPFSAEDHVVIDGHEGKVLRLTMHETVLLTLDGNHLRVPNSIVYKSAILNYTRAALRRFAVTMDIAVEESMERAIDVALRTLREAPAVLGEPAPFARVEEVGDSRVTLRFFAWMDQRRHDWNGVRSESMRLVKEAFDREEIRGALPRQEIVMLTGDSRPPSSPAKGSPQGIDTARDATMDRVIEKERAATAGDPDLLSE